MTTQKYRQDSRTLLAQARSELTIVHVRQASEKGWGAAALMLKAIAEQRGWEHGKHRHLSRVASRLRAETGDRDIYCWYQVADALHGNFYEDETAPEDIDDSLNDVERLLDKLEPVLDSPCPLPAATPGGSQRASLQQVQGESRWANWPPVS